MFLEVNILFYLLLFLVALMYASIGHGGATGYIAIMSLFNFLPEEIRPMALILNIIAASISFAFYTRKEKLNYSLAIPLLLGSIPMAFLGGQIKLDIGLYKKILAVLLVIPAYRLIIAKHLNVTSINRFSPLLLFFIGSLLGFFSGLIGIGGGVLLSPILLFFNWSNVKQTSLISALFIILNSIAGLSGFISTSSHLPNMDYLILVFVVLGACIGAYFGSVQFRDSLFRKILACVLIMAILKLIFVS